MPAERRSRDRPPQVARQAEDEAHTRSAGRFEAIGCDVVIRPEAIGQDPGRGPRSHPGNPRVVAVEDRRPAGRQRLDELPLCELDRLDRPDPRQVDGQDRRDDSDVGSGHRRELRNLAADVHPHLEDGGLVFGPETQQRERQPDLVVLVALTPERLESLGEDARSGLFRRGLGDAAGDPDDERGEPRAPAGSHRVECRKAVPHQDDCHVAEPLERHGIGRPGDDESCRSGGRGVGEEAVAVGPLAGERDEEIAGHDESRVDRPAPDRPVSRAEEASTGQPCDLGRGEARRVGPSARPWLRFGHGRKCRTGDAHGFVMLAVR